MSPTRKRNEKLIALSQAHMELRELAGLELKKRRLLRDLAEVVSQHAQLSREIKLKGTPIPWSNWGERSSIEPAQCIMRERPC